MSLSLHITSTSVPVIVSAKAATDSMDAAAANKASLFILTFLQVGYTYSSTLPDGRDKGKAYERKEYARVAWRFPAQPDKANGCFVRPRIQNHASSANA